MLQRSRTRRLIRAYMAAVCTVALLPGSFFTATTAAAQEPQAAASEGAVSIPPDQLDSLVSPIALYPDPLLAQVLAASTYPLELLQLHQWLQKNAGLKDKALIDAVSKQPWDPSIQAMAGLPDLVKRLSNDIQWTTDLGNAFLAQQNDVMDAVQRMRHKAQDKGTLTSTPQQTVQTQVVEREQVIVIEQSDPEVIYVPEYDPVWAYGAPIYPYPPIYYPTGGLALGFATGVAVGAIWGGGGGWGWGCRWGGDNDITINNNNNFNRNANIRAGNNNLSGRTNWQHRPEHRGGAPYRDRATANKYGGTARGDSLSQRQAGARQQVQRQGGNARSSGAVGTTGAGERAGALGDRSGSVSDRAGTRDPRGGVSERSGGSVSDRDRGGSLGDRGSVSDRESFGGSSGDRIGSRDLGSSDRGSGSFGSSGGFDGSKARSSSSRGGSSTRSSGGMSRPSGGGASRGGGGRSRGGGGRR